MAACFEKIHLALSTYLEARKFTLRLGNPDQVEREQNKKLRKIISHCYENIKFYHELFDEHCIKPGDVNTAADLVKLPVITKEQLRSRFWDFLPRDLPRCRVSRTSGSTGIPVCILSDINSRLNNSAAVIRYRKKSGINFWSGPILTPLKNQSQQRRKPHWTFLQGLHKTYYINPYTNRGTEIEYSIDVLKKLDKPAIIGITPAIRALAWQIRDGILPVIKPCAVITTGEYLSSQVRENLEDTFKVKVTDIYACNEAGDIAWQCCEGQFYHINADNCIVEIIKDNKPVANGQTGEVVITNLNRYSMPFIRYKNGDLARLGYNECRCGCKLPIIAEIVGRTGEDIYLPAGEKIPWNQLKGFMNFPEVRQFQLVQNKDSSLMIKYIPQHNTNIEQTKNILTARFKGLLGDTLRINFSIVDRIDPDPSGKSKLVICHYEPTH